MYTIVVLRLNKFKQDLEKIETFLGVWNFDTGIYIHVVIIDQVVMQK